ncbi:MAG: thioesterase [Streptosporangiaceae bacterium]|nr:thioesterase [Streptosporangiaceae bacterium]
MVRSAETWLVSRAPRAAATVSLYCFPHTGGAPGEYARWSDDLPGVRVRALRPPGRGSRLYEPRFARMEELVDAVVSAVTFERPFVLLGHSLGALVAFEVARLLRDRGKPPPERMIVSACPAPRLIGPRPAPRHLLSDHELLAEIERVSGPLPAEIRDDPQLLANSLQAFRADLEMLDTYIYRACDPFDYPISAIAGADDEAGTRMPGWRDHTTRSFELRRFTGAHFYFRECRHEVLSFLRHAIKDGENAG